MAKLMPSKLFTYKSRSSFTTVTWRFCESTEIDPALKPLGKIQIVGPEEVYNTWRFLFDGQVRERFAVLWLSTHNKVQGFNIISEGILAASLVHPREVFRDAIVISAASIILMHNHPSGNSEPSLEDKTITRQLVESGKIIGIPVHDHIIFAGHTFTSFAERGLL